MINDISEISLGDYLEARWSDTNKFEVVAINKVSRKGSKEVSVVLREWVCTKNIGAYSKLSQTFSVDFLLAVFTKIDNPKFRFS